MSQATALSTEEWCNGVGVPLAAPLRAGTAPLILNAGTCPAAAPLRAGTAPLILNAGTRCK